MLLVDRLVLSHVYLSQTPQRDTQFLLTLLVSGLFLVLIIIGGLAAWSRARRIYREGERLEDHEWKEELVRRMSEVIEKEENSPPNASDSP